MKKHANSLPCPCSLVVILLVSSVLAAAQKETVLYSFQGKPDGSGPQGALIADGFRNLYGTTTGGGTDNAGTVFELSQGPHNHWTETVLYSFTFSADGDTPEGNLTLDGRGNLYGTALFGGNGACMSGCGTVFELSPPAIQGGNWSFTVLYTFSGGTDGAGPGPGLTVDAQGNLYGTAGGGGIGECDFAAPGCGVVFELSPPSQLGGTWTETVLYSFSGGSDGARPIAPVVFDANGSLFGTMEGGGRVGCDFGFVVGCGVVFELSPSGNGTWVETVLHGFTTGPGHDGFAPGSGALAMDGTGALAGTTQVGGNYGDGTVYGLRRSSNGTWQYGVLYDFNISVAGQTNTGVILANGMLYGTGPEGAFANGTAYQLARIQNGAWKIRGVYNFKGHPDGAAPLSGLLYNNGAFYGTTFEGGNSANCLEGCGTVYKIEP